MKTKKILSVLLVALMALAFSGVTAFAASITIERPTGTGTDETDYTWYEIMLADIGTGNKVAYYVNSEAKAEALKGTGLFTYKAAASNNGGADDRWYIETEETDAKKIADALVDMDKTGFTSGDFTRTADKAEAKDLNPGYYLVVSSLGTNVVLRTLNDETVAEKNEYPSLTKAADKTTASIGEVVTYTVTVTVPATVAEKTITVVDVIDEALTRSAKATVAGKEVAFSGNNVVIDAATVKANAGSTITVTYTATVNDKAKVNTEMKNTAHLVYDKYTSVDVDTTVKTYGFKVQKIDDTDKSELADAEFSVWTAATGGTQIYVKLVDGVYRVDVSKAGEDGDAIVAGSAAIEGLADGTYYLQEDKAPAGYNRLSERKAIVVNENSYEEANVVKVDNKAGVQLPDTGAFGTTVFYVVGVLAILGAGVFMVTNKRIAKEEF